MIDKNVMLFCVIGLVAGFYSGLLGLGGALLIVPTLVYFGGFSQKMAQGTSLCVLLPPVGILAAVEYWKAGEVNVVAALVIIVFFVLASLFGAKLANRVNPVILRRCFAVLLFIVGLKMFF